jgi:hypothetical protein
LPFLLTNVRDDRQTPLWVCTSFQDPARVPFPPQEADERIRRVLAYLTPVSPQSGKNRLSQHNAAPISRQQFQQAKLGL